MVTRILSRQLYLSDMDIYDEFSLMTPCVPKKKGTLQNSVPAEPHKTTPIMTTEPLKAPEKSPLLVMYLNHDIYILFFEVLKF